MATHLDALHDSSNKRLLEKLPGDQIERVLAADMCDIGIEFLGFVGIYERLADIIPLDWTVIDLGCAYSPQAFFFDRHKRYIGVDLLTPIDDRFSASNTSHFWMSISDFLREHASIYDVDTSFAICSYVPDWHDNNMKLVRDAFRNVFTFYPCGKTPSPVIPTKRAAARGVLV